MFHIFFPDYYVDSTYSIDFLKLYNKGYRGIIFDVDNTLVPHGHPADERSIQLFKELKEIGFQVFLLSNNKEERVKSFQEPIGIEYIYKANKPSRNGYQTAIEKMNIKKEETIFIGDQLFTDILGAKRSKVLSFLVKPLDKKEEIQIVLKRYLEKVILFFYKQKNENLYIKEKKND
ncbi:MAG: YqeG family HAD IIIA-type phosphatase [Lachnospiraceae bacterium]